MHPKVWGSSGWTFLYATTLTYPNCPSEDNKKYMKSFLTSLGYILPCLKCRNNYKNHFKKFPLDDKALACKKNLTKWLVNVNNEVNSYTGKLPITYEDVLKDFERRIKLTELGQGGKFNKKLLVVCGILFIILLTLLSSDRLCKFFGRL